MHRALTVDDIQLGLVEIGVGRQDEKLREEPAQDATELPSLDDERRHRAAHPPQRPAPAHRAPARLPEQHLKHDITFGVGPAGTGKTWLAVACAIDAMERDTVQRLVLTRPAVEAGERLGFLPGDLAQKVDPYLRPLYDALYDLMGFDKVQRLFEKQTIEIAPLAYMRPHAEPRLHHPGRGPEHHARTDEDVPDPHRLRQQGGHHRRSVAGGPAARPRQRPGPRGQVLHDVQGIATTRFTSRDVVRHPLVARIVDAYDRAAEHDA